MAKKRKAQRKSGGPYVAAAVFCDSVVRGDDGVLTAVRMIDQITITIPADAPPDVPSEGKNLLAQIEGLIGFKRGNAGTKHSLKLVMNSPSGKGTVVFEQPAEFRGEAQGGYHLRLKSAIAVSEEGLFWLDVIMDGKLMTRMPLLISVKRADPEPKSRKVTNPKGKKS
jgi:hypothetical protein